MNREFIDPPDFRILGLEMYKVLGYDRKNDKYIKIAIRFFYNDRYLFEIPLRRFYARK